MDTAERPTGWLHGEIIDPEGFRQECALLDALPAGWLRGYVRNASTTTDCHVVYHVGAGLAALAQSAPLDLAFPFSEPMFTNLYVMLIGESGSRKTAAVKKAMRVLRSAGPVAANVHKQPASVEQLKDMVVAQPHGVLLEGEFGAFLADTQHGYRTPMKAVLTEIYDCTPISRVKANGKNTDERIPRMSLVAGITPDYLERHTEEVDFTGGFVARFILLTADRAREIENPPSDPATEAVLGERLHAYWKTTREDMTLVGECSGLDEKASALKHEWREGVKARAKDAMIAGGARASAQRAETAALKIATLIAWDSGEARHSNGQKWYVHEADLLPALRIIDWHMQSAERLASGIASDKDMRDKRAMLREMKSHWQPYGKVLRRAKLLKRRADDVLRTLVECNEIEVRIEEGVGTQVRLYGENEGDVVVRVDDGEVKPAQDIF